MLPPSTIIPIPTTTTDLSLLGGASVLTGWSFIETTGAAAAELQLFDGSSTTGALITDISLTQGQSTRDLMCANGVQIRFGLFMHVVAGSVRGSVWAVPGELYNDFMVGQGYRAVPAGHA